MEKHTALGGRGDEFTAADGDCPVEDAVVTSGDAPDMSESGINTGGRRDRDMSGIAASTTGATFFESTGDSVGVGPIEVLFDEELPRS